MAQMCQRNNRSLQHDAKIKRGTQVKLDIAYLGKSVLAYTKPTASYVNEILRALKLQPDCMTLDLGCGSGEYLHLMRQRGLQIVGVEIDREEINAVASLTRSSLPLIVADGHRLPLKNETFDFIFCKDVLEHVKEPEQVLKESRRVAKVGCKGFFVMSNGYSLNDFLLRVYGKIFRWKSPHIQFFSLKQWEYQLLKGYQVDEIYNIRGVDLFKTFKKIGSFIDFILSFFASSLEKILPLNMNTRGWAFLVHATNSLEVSN